MTLRGGNEPERTATPVFTWLTKGQDWYRSETESGTDYTTDFTDATVDQLDLSSTGMEGLVFEAVAAYLRGLTREPVRTLFDYEPLPEGAAMALAAEIAERGNFVEYGVSLRCAWLTDAGRAWLADYDKHQELPRSVSR